MIVTPHTVYPSPGCVQFSCGCGKVVVMEQEFGSVMSDGVPRRLRAFRKHRQLSLDEVAARIGVSASTLSRLESGRRRLTLELLLALAETYGTTLDELASDEPMGDPRVNLRARNHGALTIVPLCRRAGGVNAFKVVLHPGEVDNEPEHHSHAGWQWLVVLEGRLLLTLNERTFELAAGEAAEFDTHTPHNFAAVDDRPVEYLVLFGPQGEQVSLRVSTRDRARAGHRSPNALP